MLPPELLSLFLLVTTVTAIPQNEQVANGTTLLGKPPSTPTDPATDEPTDIESDPNNGRRPDFRIPSLPTADGWETSALASLVPEDNHPRILTTQTPTLVDIQTSAIPKNTRDLGANGGNAARPASMPPGQSARVGNIPNAPAQETPGNSLLLDIISRIADPQIKPQATLPATPGGSGGSGGVGQTDVAAQITQGPKAMSAANAMPVETPQAILPVGGVITAGSATLTLTPGLSTSFGTGDAATFIGITSNAAGQTLITVSSSGTAVTATVTMASATVTLPRTGFEASVTEFARPAESKTSDTAGGVAAPTSSKGLAVNTRVESYWWISLVLGILGTKGIF